MSCLVCGEPTTGKRKTCSPGCLTELRTALCYRNAAARPRPTEKTCPQCEETKPLTAEHWAPNRRNLAGEVTHYSGWCRLCSARKARERRRKRTPEQIEADRAYHRAVYERRRHDPEVRARQTAARRRWVRENRDKQRATWRRWYDGVMADPERHAAYLETIRIAYRLRRERQGHKVRIRQSTAANAWRYRHMPMPLEPFALWLDEIVATDRRDIGDIAADIEIPERRLFDYRERIPAHVALPSAERALLRYGPVRIRPETVAASPVAEQLAEHWRNAPGNGTRILGYLQATEQLTRLAGAVIVTAEDLWPS